MTASEVSYSRSPIARGALTPGSPLAFAGAVTPTLSVFAYKGLAPLFFLVAVLELWLFWRENRRLPYLPMGATVIYGAFVIWGALGAVWSLDGEASLATTGKLVLMAALGLPLFTAARQLDVGARRMALRALRGGVIAGLGFMAVEVFFDLPLTHAFYAVLHIPHPIYPSMLDPAATVLVVVTVLATGDLLAQRRFVWALGVGAAAVVLAVVSESMAAGLAGIVAAVVLAVVYWGGRAVGQCLAVITAALIIVAPLLPTRVLGPAKEYHWPQDAVASVYQRIAIWTFTESRIDARPVLGWGLDAARRIPGGHNGIRAESLDIHDPMMRERVTKYFDSGNIEQMPLHPHNAALQIWLEAGGVGAALATLLVLLALLATVRQWPVSRLGTAAAFSFEIAALTIAGLSYGIWQTWWLATLWFGAIFAGMITKPQPRE